MSERKERDPKLVAIGKLIKEKRLQLDDNFATREKFIDDRSEKLFNYDQWISERYLISLELGKNQMSVEKMILLAYALEEDPEDFFKDILDIYQQY